MKQRMTITTMGRFSIAVDGRPLPLHLSPVRQELFCSLLSPFDEYQRWERLEQLLDGPATGRRCRLAQELFVISAYFIRCAGIDPLLSGDDGVSLDHRQVKVDTVRVVQAIHRSLNCFMSGGKEEGLLIATETLPHLRGEYLPGIHGRIIDRTREELMDLFAIIRRHPDTVPPADPHSFIPPHSGGVPVWASAA